MSTPATFFCLIFVAEDYGYNDFNDLYFDNRSSYT